MHPLHLVKQQLKFLKESKLLLSVCLILGALSARAQSQPQVIEKIIAKVNDEIILTSELEFAKAQYLEQGASIPNLECKVLEALLINKMLVTKAEIDSVIVDDATIQNAIDQKRNGILQGPPAITEAMIFERYGKTLDEIIDELRPQLIDQLTASKMQTEITNDVAVTPADVKSFYKAIPKDSLPYISTEVQIGQITLLATVSDKSRKKARETIEKLRQRVLDGDDFEALAELYSQDPVSARQGGELGQFCRGDLVPEYEAICMKLNPGEYSGIVESVFGFHFIQLISRHGNCFNSRHILIKPEKTAQDLDKAMIKLDSIRTLILADSMTFSKAAYEFSDDIQTKQNGGQLYNPQTGTSRVPLESLDPTLFFTIDTMQVGTISKPIVTKAYNGESAAAIIYYKSKTLAHVANLKDDYQMISNAALAEKKNKALSDWFTKTKEDLYISVDPKYNHCNVLEPQN